MKARKHIRIGNQTAFITPDPLVPFHYAVENGFDAFEWFPDKKESGAGWDIGELGADTRRLIREAAAERDIALSVHAPWWADPLQQAAHELLLENIAFAREIGASLFNIHLHAGDGIETFAQGISFLIAATARAGLKLAIENTPLTGPDDFNRIFAILSDLHGEAAGHVGFCLDLGHANLSAATRNDYLGFMDQLAPQTPLIHIHLHENYGDRDSHLVLFTGPAGHDEAGIRGFVQRLQQRDFNGAIILEQWPEPPTLLNQARDRLLGLLGEETKKATSKTALQRGRTTARTSEGGIKHNLQPATSPARTRRKLQPTKQETGPEPVFPEAGGDDEEERFLRKLVTMDRSSRSWREKLEGVCGLLQDDAFSLANEQLILIAIYLRFLGTGEIPCIEDGRHFRPNRHARLSQQIQERLATLATMDNTFILRKIHPWLPSYDSAFIRTEPLTRIRDIAHRNDIPRELKQEIKHTLQNKLHRCAGPEDLVTSEAILQRISAPGADYPPAFVREFTLFHHELQEFFNAASLEQQLKALIDKQEIAPIDLVKRFLAAKTKEEAVAGRPLTTRLAGLATQLRERLLAGPEKGTGPRAQRLRAADIGLEDFVFVLLSRMINEFEANWKKEVWRPALRTLILTVANLRASGIEPEECQAIETDLEAWLARFDPTVRDRLLLVKACLARCRRLADNYSAKVLALFPERAARLGRALGVAEHAIRVYAEGDIRGNLVFQLARLVSLLLKKIRRGADLPPWDILVPGTACGRLVAAEYLTDLTPQVKEPQLVLLAEAAGDEEMVEGVAAILLCHELPHLSHLAVRARQEGIVFAACDDKKTELLLRQHIGEELSITAAAETLTVEPDTPQQGPRKKVMAGKRRNFITDSLLFPKQRLLELHQVTMANGGGKAAGALHLAELSSRAGAGFKTPVGMVVPFGVAEEVLHSDPVLKKEYLELVRHLNELDGDDLQKALQQLHSLFATLGVPEEITAGVMWKFAENERLMVRSSANCEDLEELVGAGLYDSVANVAVFDVADAVRRVWASLWSRRAVMSRKQASVPHDRARMAVLIQQMIVPDHSFIMHTVNPVTANRDEICVELAAGLGESIASGAMPGSPYRLVCDKYQDSVRMLAFASFSCGLWPRQGGAGGLTSRRLAYADDSLSKDARVRQKLGRRLAAIGRFVEEASGSPQDIEGVISGRDIFLVQSRPQQGL